MAQTEEVEGLVLSRRNYRERDYLIKIFTDKYGPKMFFVRGSKRDKGKLAQSLQLFAHGTFIADIREDGLSFIQDVKDFSLYRSLQTDIFLNAYATYLLQLTDAAIEDGKPEPRLLHELLKGLTSLDEGMDPEVITNIFEVKFLYYFGVMPEWRGCVVCGNTEGPFDYSSRYGGLLCKQHWSLDPHRYHASPRAIHLLRLFSILSLDRLGEISVSDETKKNMRELLDQLYEENVGIRLKSKKFIDNMHSWGDMLLEKRSANQNETTDKT